MSYPIEWVYNEGGVGPLIREYPERTSESFLRGALVIYDRGEDGVVEVARTSGVPNDQNFLGIALRAATGTAGSVIPVLIPRSGDVFKASKASAEGTDVAPETDDRGQLYGIIKRTTGHYVVDSALTTHVKVIDINPEDLAKRGLDPFVVQATTAFVAGNDGLIFRFQEAVLDNAGTQA